MKQIITVLSIGALSLLTLSTAALAHGHGCAADDAACKAKWEAKKAAFQAACGGDIKTYCSTQAADAAADKTKFREVRDCLRVNEKSLSTACQTNLAENHHHHHS